MKRPLTEHEIEILSNNGCRCANWSKISVADGFNPEFVRNVSFSGNISIGRFDTEITFFGGCKKHTGIFNATIHNCQIANNVYINKINNYLANYIIEDDAIIENVDTLAVEGESNFGNGLAVKVLNETGGREAWIYDNLSAQLAFITVFYRHKTAVIERITELIKQYAGQIASSVGTVAGKAILMNCGTIKNVRIGENARLEGVVGLTNGTIVSCQEAPTSIGAGVIAENFIVGSNSEITQGSEIYDTFVGQGCALGKQFSAENSLFFANCQGLHGEACAVFAGPYTVTHHKSTLLIGGYYSFFNAGSGTNQSNHLYKLGPVHFGTLERGSKTASDSYILWPARIGAFSLVMGRHYKHSDTSDLPFSYLIESENESLLVPAINLRSVGTMRDAKKWPKRDKRTAPQQPDCINFEMLNPYTVGKICRATEILNGLKQQSTANSDFYSYQNVKIKNSALEKGLKLYETAIDKYLGSVLIRRLSNDSADIYDSDETLRKRLLPESAVGSGKWTDLAGLIAPESEVERLLADIETGRTASLADIQNRFYDMHRGYHSFEWTWSIAKIEQRYGVSINAITFRDISRILEIWEQSVIQFDKLLFEDAKKEIELRAEFKTGDCGSCPQ